jgi:periplasmic divalent cation tolerance protein
MAASASQAKLVKLVRLVRIVLMTAGNQEQANRIARVLVDERLAACVNVIGPIRSVYRWRDAVEDETEYLLLAKTRAALCPRLERRVKELHTYEVPEVIAISPSSGSGAYLEWLMESTAEAKRASQPRTIRKRPSPSSGKRVRR